MADVAGLALTLLNASLQISDISERLHILENRSDDFVFQGHCYRCQTYGHCVKFCSQRRFRRKSRNVVMTSNAPTVESQLEAEPEPMLQDDWLRSQVTELQQETGQIPMLEVALANSSEANALLLSDAEKLRSRVGDLVCENEALQSEVHCLKEKRRKDEKKRKLTSPQTVQQGTQTPPARLPDVEAGKTRHCTHPDVDDFETESVDSSGDVLLDHDHFRRRRATRYERSPARTLGRTSTSRRTSYPNFMTLLVFRIFFILKLVKQMFYLLIGVDSNDLNVLVAGSERLVRAKLEETDEHASNLERHLRTSFDTKPKYPRTFLDTTGNTSPRY